MTQRTHTCSELTLENDKQEVVLIGWAQRIRDHGGKKFIDLRDRKGITQVVFDPDVTENFSEVESFRREFVLEITGTVRPRPEGTINEKHHTGEVEVLVSKFVVVNACEVLPFDIDDDHYSDVNEETRLEYRYLDLRRPQMQQVIMRRHKFLKAIRDVLDQEDFIEIDTPNLTKSTPEGSRDFIVPYRKKHGQFFALPQSPQMFKQMLMVAGYERYFQYASCFRDEDLRKDRQYEHKQLDMEMSFANRDELFTLTETMFSEAFKRVYGVKIETPFPRLTYNEIMEKYGSDKPDLRIQGLELKDISDIAAECGFSVFKGVVERSGIVKGLNLKKGQAHMSRKDIDKLIEFSQEHGAKGLAWMKVLEDGSIESSITKFFKDEELDEIKKRLEGESGDLLFFVADSKGTTNDVLDAIRRELAGRYDLIDKSKMAFACVVDFPLFQWNEESDTLTFEHSPFTMPNEEDVEFLRTLDPKDLKANKDKLLAMGSEAYDLVCNGMELGSGALRIFYPDLQRNIFKLLGMDDERIEKSFGWFIKAYEYGAPYHRGWGLGIDRIIMIAEDKANIREVIPFPRNKHGYDPLTDSPAEVDPLQLRELGIEVKKKKEN